MGNSHCRVGLAPPNPLNSALVYQVRDAPPSAGPKISQPTAIANLMSTCYNAISKGALERISLDPKLVGAIVAGAGFVIWILAVLVNDFPFSNQFWFYVRWVGGLFIGAGLTMFLAQLGALPSGTIGPLEFGSSGGGATPPPPGGGTPPPPPPPG